MHILAGKHYKRKLVVPKGVELRPTFSRLKSTLFDILQEEIIGAKFLDLFAGIGGMGLEAISRGAKKVVFIEKERKAIGAIKENIALLNEEKQCSAFCLDVFDALKRLSKKGETFDIIFADPPYGTEKSSLSNQVLDFLDEHSLLSQEGHLFLEDDERASQEERALKTLKLKSRRNVGHATLRHYVHL